MKDALKAMIQDGVSDAEETARSKTGGDRYVKGPPRKYEKIIEKLESDIRGHIRLEHEMKIHMDYLEDKVERLQAWEKEKKKMQRQLETM